MKDKEYISFKKMLEYIDKAIQSRTRANPLARD